MKRLLGAAVHLQQHVTPVTCRRLAAVGVDRRQRVAEVASRRRVMTALLDAAVVGLRGRGRTRSGCRSASAA